LIVADIDGERVQRVADEFGATGVGLDELLSQDVDVIAPCALGAILNEHSIPELKAAIIAGGANNQLETPEDGQRLHDAGILYAPDYVINGGGIINVASEYYADATDEEVFDRIAAIGPRLTDIFKESAATGQPTNVVADAQARKIIASAA
jgi:leucine dehydrogenase